jgi:hypothetical protein
MPYAYAPKPPEEEISQKKARRQEKVEKQL